MRHTGGAKQGAYQKGGGSDRNADESHFSGQLFPKETYAHQGGSRQQKGERPPKRKPGYKQQQQGQYCENGCYNFEHSVRLLSLCGFGSSVRRFIHILLDFV